MDKLINAHFNIGEHHDIAGYLDISDENNKLRCWSPSFFYVENHSDIFGITDDNEQVSLLDCLGSSSECYKNGKSSYSYDIYSHLIISGGEYINRTEDSITSISFSIVNPERIISSKSGFGTIFSPNKELIKCLNEQKFAPDFSESNPPAVAFFDGKYEIFKQETNIGTVSATNSVHINGGSINGINLNNTVSIKIDFDSSVSLDTAFNRANFLSMFLRTISGDGLSFNNIIITKNNHKLKVYKDNYNWGREQNDIYHAEPLIDLKNIGFASILKQWLLKSDRQNARYSFFNTYFKSTFSYERIITAANMFDILPTEGSTKRELTESAAAGVCEIKKAIKIHFANDLDVRNNLLQSVGFLKNKTLKDKIQSRADLILPVFEKGQLKNIDLVIHHAVKCRNYFVHGSIDKEISPDHYIGLQSFFINTLEFIFITSELVECGWDPKEGHSSILNHKIRNYVREYANDLDKLKSLLVTNLKG